MFRLAVRLGPSTALCVATAAIATVVAAQTPAAFSIDQVLNAPFPTALVASPLSGTVAWVSDSAGRRAIWRAEAPNYRPLRLASYPVDDGQQISDLSWLPDASGVLYVRGGPPNAAGELPNPALLPGGVERDIIVLSFRAAVPQKLAEGSEPAVAPATGAGAGHVAYIHQNQIWWVRTDSAQTPQQLLHTRGTISSLRWSPTAGALAFVSDRNDHAFIGVYDVASRTLRYVAPSVDRDADPVWSADGRRIAFVRVPARTRVEVFGPHLTGRPWAIWVADASTGAAHAIWTASPGPGSVFRHFDGPDDDRADNLMWTAADRIIFPWEGTGWLRLYAISADGGPVAALTPGPPNFEVQYASLTQDRKTVLLSSNQGDSERRHLWRIDVSPYVMGVATPITSGSGIEWAPVASPDGSRIACLHSDARTPAHPVLVVGSTLQDIAPIPASFPTADLVVPQDVTFRSADGLLIHGQLFLPAADAPRMQRPAIVFVHGGSRRQMLLGFHYMHYYHNAYAFNQYLASRGYVVLSVNYRSGIGYGLSFREVPQYGATGAREYADIVAAARYLRKRPDVDAAHIGIWGGSWGGYLTALALARNSDLFAAGVDMHGVHDWNLETAALIPGWDIEKDLAARRIAFAASPMASLAHWRSPVLLIQGDDDRSVAFAQTVQLTEDLRARNVHVETLVFPDEGHEFLLYAHWIAAYWASADFFDRTLRMAGATH